MVLGGLVVVPLGLLAKITGQPVSTVKDAVDTHAVAARARAIIMEVERSLGFEPIDREFEKLGYDIESRDPKTGKLRFIEVKGRVSGAQTLTVIETRFSTRSTSPTTSSSPSSSSSTATLTASTTCAGPSSASRISASPA